MTQEVKFSDIGKPYHIAQSSLDTIAIANSHCKTNEWDKGSTDSGRNSLHILFLSVLSFGSGGAPNPPNSILVLENFADIIQESTNSY